MEELIIGDKTYLPSKRAAEITGYAKDYIGQLCREGRVEAKLVGRSWYVLESSIREHRFGPSEPGVEAVQEEKAVHIETPTEPEAVKTWESPVYTAEPLEEVVPLVRPTSIADKAQNQESEVSYLQESWESWFSKPEQAQEHVQVTEHVVEEKSEDSVPPPEAPLKEASPEVEAVPLRRIPQTHHQEAYMDLRPVTRRKEAQILSSQRPFAKPHSGTRRTERKAGRLIGTAAFIGFAVLVVAISIIGLGFFDSISSENQFASPIIDFIGGVERAHKQ